MLNNDIVEDMTASYLHSNTARSTEALHCTPVQCALRPMPST